MRLNTFDTTYIPWKSGANFQHVSGPDDVNWPRASSRKKMGVPRNTIMIVYGTRNAAMKIHQ